ncbi:MAG: alpha/beta hydrolase [Actinomycetota bacterium]|nr:alpha/beta hydrolase [Actinomycetota bacterium]
MSTTPYYDPEVKAELEAGRRFGTVNESTLARMRADGLAANALVPLSDDVVRTDHEIQGPDGAPLRLRVHRPVGIDGPLPALCWLHGGGYVMGSPEQDDLRFDRWCRRFGLMGVVVDYRLAPEHPYPAPIEDCYGGLKWVKEHGGDLGIDTDRVGIGGPSGGGGLAAALALVVRDRAEFAVDYQVLIYPMIDDTRTTVTAGWPVPIWNPESNEFGWRSYLGPLFGTDDVPSHAAPARCADVSGLPPTFIMVGSLDGFADEDITYAQRLNQAGVAVELHVYPGAPHGFEGFAPQSAVSRQARRDLNNWLGVQLKAIR